MHFSHTRITIWDQANKMLRCYLWDGTKRNKFRISPIRIPESSVKCIRETGAGPIVTEKTVLRSRSRWSRNYLRPGAGAWAQIIFLLNIFLVSFEDARMKKNLHWDIFLMVPVSILLFLYSLRGNIWQELEPEPKPEPKPESKLWTKVEPKRSRSWVAYPDLLESNIFFAYLDPVPNYLG